MRNIEGFLVTVDIEKAFDSLDHNFLISILEKYGFGQNFILWVKILLNDQELCVINGGKTTKYFMLGRGACQGEILALEILFLLIKTKPDIAVLTVFDHCYLYSAYADHTFFFLKNTISIKNMVDTFHFFSDFSGLKPNLSKCEITGIGVLKGVQVVVCGMRCVTFVFIKVKKIIIIIKKYLVSYNFCEIVTYRAICMVL